MQFNINNSGVIIFLYEKIKKTIKITELVVHRRRRIAFPLHLRNNIANNVQRNLTLLSTIYCYDD